MLVDGFRKKKKISKLSELRSLLLQLKLVDWKKQPRMQDLILGFGLIINFEIAGMPRAGKTISRMAPQFLHTLFGTRH